jgi:hypothetical protein
MSSDIGAVAARRRGGLVRAAMGSAAALAVWGLAASVQAGDPPQQQQQQNGAPSADQPKKPDPLDRVVCRTEEETGSLISRHRVCHTQREWNQLADDAKRSVDDTHIDPSRAPH